MILDMKELSIPLRPLHLVQEHVSSLTDKQALREDHLVSQAIGFIFKKHLPEKMHLVPEVEFRVFADGKHHTEDSSHVFSEISWSIWLHDSAEESLDRVLDEYKTVGFLKSEAQAKLLAKVMVLHCVLNGKKHRVLTDIDKAVIKQHDSLTTLTTNHVDFTFPKFETLEEASAAFTLAGYDMGLDWRK